MVEMVVKLRINGGEVNGCAFSSTERDASPADIREVNQLRRVIAARVTRFKARNKPCRGGAQ